MNSLFAPFRHEFPATLRGCFSPGQVENIYIGESRRTMNTQPYDFGHGKLSYLQSSDKRREDIKKMLNVKADVPPPYIQRMRSFKRVSELMNKIFRS